MAKLKCPRCKSPLKNNDTFCKSCGAPVRSETKNVKKEIVEKIEEKDIEIVEKKEEINVNTEQNKKIKFMAILSLSMIILGIILGYFLFYKEEIKCKVCNECEKCAEPTIEYIEKEPTTQLINFKGYRFLMPIDWNFEGNTDDYKFINEEENLYASIAKLDNIEYETFITKDYQNTYLEKLQTAYNIEIIKKYEEEKDEIKYYVLEGTFESYQYMIVVTKNDTGIFMTEAQFKNNSVLTAKKQEVIDFTLSSNKNDEM